MINITKLEAARRQVETAITLFFAGGDPIAGHTLAAAGYDILRDINKHVGGKPMMVKDSIEKVLQPLNREDAKRARDLLNAPQNFFKHADRDPEGTFSFEESLTELLLFDASLTYWHLSGDQPMRMRAFTIWFKVQHPEIFPNDDDLKRALNAGALTREWSRKDFYRLVMAALTKNDLDAGQ